MKYEKEGVTEEEEEEDGEANKGMGEVRDVDNDVVPEHGLSSFIARWNHERGLAQRPA